MNLFQLVFKQMRQRALSTWLTLLSVMLGVALAVAIMVMRREAAALFGQSDFGYEALVGIKGSPLQLTLNTVYQIDKSPGNIPYAVFDDLMKKRVYRSDIRYAFPVAVGDSYKGRRIVGAIPQMFGFGDDGKPLAGYDSNGKLLKGFQDPNSFDLDHSENAPPLAGEALGYRLGQKYQIAQGRMFHGAKFEAVIGADVQKLTQLKLGDVFQATHGMPAPNEKPDIHAEKWTVVGVLDRTHTAADGVVYIPLTSFYTIFEHGEAELDRDWMRKGWNPATRPKPKPGEDEDDVKHYSLNPDGTIKLDLPKESMEVSAIFIKTRGGFNVMDLMQNVNLRDDVMAISPAEEMRKFFDTFLAGSSVVLLLIAILVTVVAAVGILVSIYNAISARLREIAILRALGATRVRVLTLICLEASLIGLVGGILGLAGGHLLAALGSGFFQSKLGQGINWTKIDANEWLYLGAVVVIAALAGLAPAMKAYRTPVATNLVAG